MILTGKAKELSQRLHRALLAKGLTQVEAARQAGLPRNVVHKAANRGSTPRPQAQRDALAKALGVSSTWLWHGVEEALAETQIAQSTKVDDRPARQPVPDAKPAPVTAAKPAQIAPDTYVVLFESDEAVPFVQPGHGVLVSPSTPPKLGELVRLQSPAYSGIAKYLGVMGDDILFVLPSGREERVVRKDVTRMEAVVGRVAGVIVQ